MAAPAVKVRYLGFVHIRELGGGVPGPKKIKKAFKLLKRPKAAREIHPLFARGFDTVLDLRVSERGLVVTIVTDKGNAIVMDHPIHKITCVVDMGKAVCFIARKSTLATEKKFKLHGFSTQSSEQAKILAKNLAEICNRVYKKLRRTSRLVYRKSMALDSFQLPETIEEETSEEAERKAQQAREEAELAVALELEKLLYGENIRLEDKKDTPTRLPDAEFFAELMEEQHRAERRSSVMAKRKPAPSSSYEEEDDNEGYEWFGEEYDDDFANMVRDMNMFDLNGGEIVLRDDPETLYAEVALEDEYFEVVGGDLSDDEL